LAILPAWLVALACYLTAYQPVLQSRSQLAHFYAGAGVESSDNQLLLAESAVYADPLSIEAARLLAHEYFERWRTSRDADMLDDFRKGCRYLGQIAPNSSINWAQVGRWYATVYQLSPQQEQLFAPLAEEAFRRAVDLFPNSAALRAELARVLETRGNDDDARREASEALRLDQIMGEAGHTDKLLSDELRNAAKRIASSTANSGAKGADVEPP
jgi:tetratricopeptide (TPR) repeat protein